MGEHKQKNPGEVKGQEYRKEQRQPIRARWVVVAELSDKWFERHYPGYLKRRAANEAERARKAKEMASKGKGMGGEDRALTGQESTKQVADSD